MTDKRPVVIHFQRKRRGNSNFSLEFIFSDVRERLKQKFDIRVVEAAKLSNGIWNRIVNIFQAASHQGDINHVTGDIHYVTLLLSKKKTILTILDCGFMNEPNRLKRWIFKVFWLRMPVARSKYITAISTATKMDIIRYTKCDPDKITIIPVAVGEIFTPSFKTFNATCPRLLQIGTAINKNIERLVLALRGIPCTLVIIGKLSESQKQQLEKNNIQFINRFNITQEAIYEEYCLADIVTFVSTFEGFGMPIIEANYVERPVIVGNNSSMPEVGGDAAYYVDASSVEDIRQGILTLMNDEELREQLIRNGRLNRTRYSNQAIANMYGQLYERVLMDMN